MKFGFIGAGNMVSAIVKGMTANGYDGKNIFITSKTVTSAAKLAEACGANSCQTAGEVIAQTDVVVLGVKPHILAEILPGLQADFAAKKPLVVSIAAGKTLEYLAEHLPKDTPIVRVMPNINAKIGASTTGICHNDAVTAEQLAAVKAVFATIGSVAEIPENHFGIFSVIGGAAVAFHYMYMDALARAALKAGMPKKQALEIVAETVKGSAEMVLKSGEAPWPLVDQVCSPGGTTIEAMRVLEERGLYGILAEANDKCIARAYELGK